MINKKIILGQILIIVGILIPLVAFFSLSYRNIAANLKYKNYISKSKTIDEKTLVNYNEILSKDYFGVVDPFNANDYSNKIENIDVNKDEVFAYLIIPKLNLKRPIYLDATKKHLSKGVAQIAGTSLPIGGFNTRSVIAGHRGWWGDIMFFNLDELKNGDKVNIDVNGKKLVYELYNKEVIGPADWDKLEIIRGQDTLTLLTCHPLSPPRPYRLILDFKRVDDINKAQNANNNKIEKAKIDKEVLFLDNIIYIITVIGLFFLILEIKNLFKYIK